MTSTRRRRQKSLLLHRAVDQGVDVALAEPDRADTGRDADLAHQRGQHLRQEIGRVVRPRRTGRQQLGSTYVPIREASNVNRNAAGAVSDTAIPCGTIAWSAS